MTESMIERVARAMAENAGFSWNACAQSQWRADARAAITAMREPSEEMLDAGDSVANPYGIADNGGGELYETDPAEVWQAMIDSVLAEKP